MKQLALRIFPLALTLAACADPVPYNPGTAGGTTTGTTGGTNVCGTGSATIKYTANVSGVLTSYCLSGCHAAGAAQAPNYPLDTYANATATLTAGNNFPAVVTNGTPFLMPPAGALSANNQCILTTWASTGYTQ